MQFEPGRIARSGRHNPSAPIEQPRRDRRIEPAPALVWPGPGSASPEPVLRLMARGGTNAEIASGPYVAEATLKTQVGRISAELAVRDRAAAIVAFDQGVVMRGAPCVAEKL